MVPKGQLVNRLTGFHPHFNASCNGVEIKPHLASDKKRQSKASKHLRVLFDGSRNH